MEQRDFDDRADKISGNATLVCVIIGAVLGLIAGASSEGGTGAGILGLIIGAVIGGVLSGPLGFLLVLFTDTTLMRFLGKLAGIVAAILLVIWLIPTLWGK